MAHVEKSLEYYRKLEILVAEEVAAAKDKIVARLYGQDIKYITPESTSQFDEDIAAWSPVTVIHTGKIDMPIGESISYLNGMDADLIVHAQKVKLLLIGTGELIEGKEVILANSIPEWVEQNIQPEIVGATAALTDCDEMCDVVPELDGHRVTASFKVNREFLKFIVDDNNTAMTYAYRKFHLMCIGLGLNFDDSANKVIEKVMEDIKVLIENIEPPRRPSILTHSHPLRRPRNSRW